MGTSASPNLPVPTNITLAINETKLLNPAMTDATIKMQSANHEKR